MSAPRSEWRKSGPVVPVLCVVSLVLMLVIACVIAPLVATGVIPFAA